MRVVARGRRGRIKPASCRRFGGYPAADCIIPIVSSAVPDRGTDSEPDQRREAVYTPAHPWLMTDERDVSCATCTTRRFPRGG